MVRPAGIDDRHAIPRDIPLPPLELRRFRKTLRWGAAFGAAGIVLCLAFVDRPVIAMARRMDASVREVFDIITHFGESTWYLVSFAVLALLCWLLALKRHAVVFVFAFCAVAGPGLANQLLKVIFGRTRPAALESLAFYEFHPFMGFEWNHQSMPSGHACNAATLTVVFCTLLPHGRYFWPLPYIVIACSRVVLDVHFPSDVVFGYTLGLLGALGVRVVFERRLGMENLRLIGGRRTLSSQMDPKRKPRDPKERQE